jgi:transcriptional regulator with AAA-type ATPase domain
MNVSYESRGTDMGKFVERELVRKRPEFRAALRHVEIAPAGCATLLQGEPGIGKELFARAIHKQLDASFATADGLGGGKVHDLHQENERIWRP